MIVTTEQHQDFQVAAEPLIKWLNENCHPHVMATVDCNRAELLEGVCSIVTDKYIKD